MAKRSASELDWSGEDVSVEGRWVTIKQNAVALQDEFVPLVPFRSKKRPLWWTRAIRCAIRMRDRNWQKYKWAFGHGSWVRYKEARNQAVRLQRAAKYKLERKLAQNAKRFPKMYYSYAQSKGKTHESVGTIQLEDGSVISSDENKAAAFVGYFQSVHRADDSHTDPQVDRGFLPTLNPSTLCIDTQEVETVLLSLDGSKSAGPDGIHPRMLKILASEWAGPICQPYNASLQQGVVPMDWKQAIVVPIHKGGSKCELQNYRPVNLTSVICKVLERIIRDRLCKFSNWALLAGYCSTWILEGEVVLNKPSVVSRRSFEKAR